MMDAVTSTSPLDEETTSRNCTHELLGRGRHLRVKKRSAIVNMR